MSVRRSLLMLASGILVGGMVCGQAVGQMPLGMTRSEPMEDSEIETDRDSFTPATTTVGCGRFIVEGAYTFVDNLSVPETHSFPELLVRRGIREGLELRLGWNYEVGGAGSPVSGNSPGNLGEDITVESESRFLYGLKSRVSEQGQWRPESALIIQGYTPTSGEANDTQMSAGYIFGWTLPSELVWDTAVRYSTSSLDDDNFNVWAPSTVLKMPIGERWKVHAEYFGIFSEGRADETIQHFFSPGAHYLVNQNFELGFRVGWGLNDDAPNFFSNVGFGWQF